MTPRTPSSSACSSATSRPGHVWTTAGDIASQYAGPQGLAHANRLKWQIYASVNPRIAGKRGDASVTLARCVFVDFDKTAPHDALVKLAGPDLPRPTMTIASGHGLHAYWRLRYPTSDLPAWSAMQSDMVAFLGQIPQSVIRSGSCASPAFSTLRTRRSNAAYSKSMRRAGATGQSFAGSYLMSTGSRQRPGAQPLQTENASHATSREQGPASPQLQQR